MFGAGSVGLAVGARLGAAGARIHFWTRSEAQAAALAGSGATAEDPATGERWHAPATASAGRPSEAPEADDAGAPVLLCVRSPETEAALEVLAAAAPDALVASVQNGISNDAAVARRFARALGVVWRLTCTRVGPGRTRVAGRARVVVGANPDAPARRTEVRALAEAFRRAGFDVGVSRRLAEDRWLKLCVNLLSTPNALVRPDEHATRSFVAAKLALLEEARAVLAAAGIRAVSCDGRDPDLDAMIDAQRAALERPPPPRRLPVYNDVWTALREDRPLEAVDHHGALLALARRHRVPAPANERAVALLERARRERRGPECASADDLLV